MKLKQNLAAQEQALVQAENAFLLSRISLAQLLLITDYENFDIATVDYDLSLIHI